MQQPQQADPALQALQEIVQADQADRVLQRYRAEVQDEVARVAPCDGEDPGLVKCYLRELNLVPDPQRLDVLRKTARGALRREFEHLVGQIQVHGRLPNWNETRTHILGAFVAVDTQEAQHTELKRVKQQPYETILS